MSKVYLTKANLVKISETLEKFPEVHRVEIREYSKTELGSCVDISFDTVIKDIKSRVTITISDERDW